MNIVVLDGYAMNPGDMSWQELTELGDCAIYDRTPPDEIIARAHGAEIILTNKTVLDKNILRSLPELRYIGVLATGYNVVDIDTASKQNIVVTNVPAYSTDAVAQAVFAHIFNLTHHLGSHAEEVRGGEWCRSKDFSYWKYPLVELTGLTMGIIGYGLIGKAVAKRAAAFNMNICIHTPHPQPGEYKDYRFEDLDTLLKESDVITLHCPLTDATNELINHERLSQMKKSALLINTGRGPLINEQELADALNAGSIAGAGLDVLSQEPPSPDNPLLAAKNCFITPHYAWATDTARKRLLEITISNIKAFLNGEPQNMVNR